MDSTQTQCKETFCNRDCNITVNSTLTDSEPTRSIVVIWVINFQTELVVEIYSKSLVRAIGKVLLMKFS